MSAPTPRQELIRLRLTSGLSLTAQARTIGIARNALSHAENGEPVRLFTARKIAQHYERPILELFPELMEQACSSS